MIRRSGAAAPAPRPATGAAPFGPEELFFSRTDERGVIEAFNGVFLRIANFAPERLMGAPHRIIRHEDMPRGVFWLLWEGLKAGHTMSAYVKNRASDGLYYWVYALVTPIEGGYISVRLKPSSDLLGVVEQEYAGLLAAEKSEGLTPEASGRRLLARLAELGFPTHGGFQAHCLATEVISRGEKLGRLPDRSLHLLRDILEAARCVAAEQTEVAREIARMRLVPFNMRIMAARIEPQGGPLSAISDNYRGLAAELAEKLEGFLGEGQTADPFAYRFEERALFLRAADTIVSEVAANFAAEREHADGIDDAAEAQRLDALSRRYCEQSRDALAEANRRSGRLIRDVESLRRAILSLDSVRILCRVEDGRLGRKGNGIASVIGALEAFHKGMAQRLDTVLGRAQMMQSQTASVIACAGSGPALRD